MFSFTKKFITTIATMLAIFTLAAAPAGAIDDDLLPGGNGPDVEPIDVIEGITALPLGPQASVDVSCTDETATARIENPTNNFYAFAIRVDGALVNGGVTVQNGLTDAVFPVAENETVAVEIEVSGDLLIDQEFTRDCLLADPSYTLLEDCDSEQAHVRLINNGDDVANMAVAYDGVPYVLHPVAPHSSVDWLLAVDPGESADFTIKFGHDVDLGSESFTFSCPEEPAPTTTTTPETTNPGTPVEPVNPEPVTPTQTPDPVTPTEPTPGSQGESSSDEATNVDESDVDELTSEDAEAVDGTTEDVEVEELAFGSDDGSDDGTDDDKSGIAFGKLALGGFSLLLLFALVAALLYSERQEMQTA